MKRNIKRYVVEQTKAPVSFLDGTIKDIEIKKEDVDTIEIRVEFTSGKFISKKFKKYSFEYMDIWKKLKVGDDVILKIQAGAIKGISLIRY